MTFFHNYANSVAIIVLAVAIWWRDLRYTRHLRRIEGTLDRVRMATYELTTAAREDIEDLQAALEAAGIKQPRPQYKERLRRMALTPEEREIESMERFEQVVSESQRRIDDA